ncbi:hypothetical protein CrV_gp114 [Cylindrospermopsis raciborskii virus RM-2018a]|nr:hypothetical protein CrV_gp077 [Cylindrospermopsis raciborskii virus RM-2018a]AXK90524.1 hypothetical protein CrV_gp114 [Cylindrospermopsis raciborskii virus RM-2018a]
MNWRRTDMELLEELRERLKDCPNFEVFQYKGEIYARYVKPYRFFKVIDLEGLSRSLPVVEPGRIFRLSLENLKCLQEIPSNTRS